MISWSEKYLPYKWTRGKGTLSEQGLENLLRNFDASFQGLATLGTTSEVPTQPPYIDAVSSHQHCH